MRKLPRRLKQRSACGRTRSGDAASVRSLFVRILSASTIPTIGQLTRRVKSAAMRMTKCISRALLLSDDDIDGDGNGQSVSADGEWYKLNISKEETSCDNNSFYGSR